MGVNFRADSKREQLRLCFQGRQAGFCPGLCCGTVGTGIHLGCWAHTHLWQVTGLQHTTAEEFYILRRAKDSLFSLWHWILVFRPLIYKNFRWSLAFLSFSWKNLWLESSKVSFYLSKLSAVKDFQGIYTWAEMPGWVRSSQPGCNRDLPQPGYQPGWNTQLMYPCSFWS